jgi:hypothetical protein
MCTATSLMGRQNPMVWATLHGLLSLCKVTMIIIIMMVVFHTRARTCAHAHTQRGVEREVGTQWRCPWGGAPSAPLCPVRARLGRLEVQVY